MYNQYLSFGTHKHLPIRDIPRFYLNKRFIKSLKKRTFGQRLNKDDIKLLAVWDDMNRD